MVLSCFPLPPSPLRSILWVVQFHLHVGAKHCPIAYFSNSFIEFDNGMDVPAGVGWLHALRDGIPAKPRVLGVFADGAYRHVPRRNDVFAFVIDVDCIGVSVDDAIAFRWVNSNP